jgi:hypothetical protein
MEAINNRGAAWSPKKLRTVAGVGSKIPHSAFRIPHSERSVVK